MWLNAVSRCDILLTNSTGHYYRYLPCSLRVHAVSQICAALRVYAVSLHLATRSKVSNAAYLAMQYFLVFSLYYGEVKAS